MAGEAVAHNAADSVTESDTQGDGSVTRWPRSRVRRVAARSVLVVALLITAMALCIPIACFIDDRTVEEARGEAVAEVVDTSLTRTVVRFSTPEGRVYIPPNGVLYPEGLQPKQLVRVEYDSRNPDLVRVAGRTAVLSLLPVAGLLAGTWVVLLPVYLLIRPRR